MKVTGFGAGVKPIAALCAARQGKLFAYRPLKDSAPLQRLMRPAPQLPPNNKDWGKGFILPSRHDAVKKLLQRNIIFAAQNGSVGQAAVAGALN